MPVGTLEDKRSTAQVEEFVDRRSIASLWNKQICGGGKKKTKLFVEIDYYFTQM